jgi:hypothetical protein
MKIGANGGIMSYGLYPRIVDNKADKRINILHWSIAYPSSK